MATTIQSQVTKYTVGLFGAAAGGYMNGLAAYFVNGGTEQGFVTSLVDTVEYKTYMINWSSSSVTNQQRAEALVENLLSTSTGTAYDQGVAAVKALLDAGQSFSTAAYTAINFVATATDATYAPYAQAFNARVDNALMYNQNGGNSLNLFELQSEASPNVTLTNGTDIRTGNIFDAPQVYTPGGDDRINSLQDEDTLTGIGTNPTLNATQLGNANDNGAAIITPTLSGLATLNLGFTGSGAAAVTALDLQDGGNTWTDINVTRVSQAINTAEVGNIMNAVPRMTLTNTNSNAAGVVEFSFNAGALSGSNTGTMTLDNVNVLTLNIGQNTSAIAARGVGTQGYENLTVTVKGSSNDVVGTLNAPQDTGVTGTVTLKNDTGSTASLRVGAQGNIVNAGNAALIEVAGLATAATGLQGTGGRLATYDGSGMAGALTLVLDNVFDIGQAGTSGAVQNVTVKGGAGADVFHVFDAIQAGDKLEGGAASDTLVLNATDNVAGANGSIASVASSIEALRMLSDGVAMTADFDNLPDVTGVEVRNVGNAGGVNAASAAVVFTLDDLTTAQAAAITVTHSTTGNTAIADTTVAAELKTNTASDTLGIIIGEGTNIDQNFNFTVDRDAGAVVSGAIITVGATFENVTITDTDTESNSIELNDFATHNGVLTLTGGAAGKYINFDVDTAGADVTGVTTGATADGGQVQQGLLGLDTSDVTNAPVNFATGNIFDVGVLATQVRFSGTTIAAGGEASDVIVRVSTNLNATSTGFAAGGQSITTGTGNDTVIFDFLTDNRAGLTISDTVAGGTGTDTLAIDGNGVNVTLGASEWTNVSGFENIRLVGLGAFAYNLTLTNELIAANGVAGLINIINDNDVSNDAASGANTATTGVESAVTIDARLLSAANSFTYNGEENAGVTADRFIMVDANVNGKAIIDGGAANNVVASNDGPNGDVLEVRNTAVVTAGDLANVKNVGTIAFNNDQAVAQTLTLQLNDTVVDSMIDSYHVAGTGLNIETLNVTLTDAGVVEVAPLNVTLDVLGLTTKSTINLTLNNVLASAGVDTLGLASTGGKVVVANFETTADALLVPGVAKDKIQLSKAAFAALTSVVGAGFSVAGEYLANATGVAADANDFIIHNTTTGDVWYDADGNAAGAAVLIATLTGVSDLAAADFVIVA